MIGPAGMDRRITQIEAECKQAAEADAVSDAHALAQGEADGLKKPKRPVSPDKPRDLEEEAQKGNKKRLAEFRDRLGRLEYHHGELVHSLNPSHFVTSDDGDPCVLPAGQPENPGPLEMVDPVCPAAEKTAMNMEAARGPGTNLPPADPRPMHTPDGTQSKHYIPGKPVPASEMNRLERKLPLWPS